MRKKFNRKGFTLIELLAVIVILGVIMAIAIPSMTGYIANSKKDALLNSAQQMLSGAKDMLTSENAYPGPLEAVIVPINELELDKGGISPYDNREFDVSHNQSYVLVYNEAADHSAVTSSSYKYYIGLADKSGNCLQVVSEKLLTSSKTKKKRSFVKGALKECGISEGKVDTTSYTVLDDDFPNGRFTVKTTKVYPDFLNE